MLRRRSACPASAALHNHADSSTTASSQQRPSWPSFRLVADASSPSSVPALAETSSPVHTSDDSPPTPPPLEPLPPASPPKGPLDWLFGFLRNGSSSVAGSSSLLGDPKKSTSLLRPQQASGGLLSKPFVAGDRASFDIPLQNTTAAPSRAPSAHSFPSWDSWKDWKKISLDFYIRLLDTPQYSRLRLKQTVALLPVVKLKPVIDLQYRGPGQSPLTMHLDVKLLDCIKYRVKADGTSRLQVRAKAPLSDPRFAIDVIYERQIGTPLDSVKISFRALDVAFLKAPSPGFGCKFPIRFNNGIKTTIRVKKFLTRDDANSPDSWGATKPSRRGQPVRPKTRVSDRPGRAISRSVPLRKGRPVEKDRFGLFGPIGVDLKLRCLEYR